MLLFIDNIFRFTPGRLRGLRAARAACRRAVGYQPTLGDRDGRAAGAHHVDEEGLDHVGAGDLRAGRRHHRPGAGHGVRAPRRHHRALAPDHRAGHLPGGGPARLDLAHPRPARSSAQEHYDVARAVQQIAAALQGPAGHHRHPRHGGAVRTRTSSSWRAPARSSASCRSRSSWPRLFTGQPGRYVKPRRHDPAASRRSSRASTTTCPSRPSTWSAASRKSQEKAGEDARGQIVQFELATPTRHARVRARWTRWWRPGTRGLLSACSPGQRAGASHDTRQRRG